MASTLVPHLVFEPQTVSPLLPQFRASTLLASLSRQIPNSFGRLWLTARAADGIVSPLIDAIADPDWSVAEFANCVRHAQACAFRDWIALPLARQFRELQGFVHNHAMDHAELLHHLRERRTVLQLIPQCALPMECALFQSDLAMIVDCLFAAL